MLVADNTVRICFALLYYDSAHSTNPPARSLDRELMLRHLPRAMEERGHRVSVVHLYPRWSNFDEHGVGYQFVPSSWWAQTTAAAAHRLAGIERARAEPATRAIRCILDSQPDVIHLFGTNLTLNTWLLFRTCSKTDRTIVVADHGGDPPAGRLGRALLGYGLSRAAGLLFTTVEHARPFIEAGLINDKCAPISELMEVSTTFRRLDRDQARNVTEMGGDPVFLWAGRLEPVKDPVTALRGFERIHGRWPGAQLYLYYLTDHLLPELRAFIHSRPQLTDCVHFRGSAPHRHMESVFNSADFLLQSSRPTGSGNIVETSGYVPLEAMACGVIPVLSEIPSFRVMTAEGRFGVLFPCGDDEALARGVLALSRDEIGRLGRSAQDHFEREFSFPAMARKLELVYRQASRRSNSTRE
jgi:glycosyltransferase involved in cell wall biosynthesis